MLNFLKKLLGIKPKEQKPIPTLDDIRREGLVQPRRHRYDLNQDGSLHDSGSDLVQDLFLLELASQAFHSESGQASHESLSSDDSFQGGGGESGGGGASGSWDNSYNSDNSSDSNSDSSDSSSCDSSDSGSSDSSSDSGSCSSD